MIVHIALFKWKSSIPQKEIDNLMRDIESLQWKIPEVVQLYAGENFSIFNQGFTQAVVVITNDREGLEVYRHHDFHLPLAQKVESFAENSLGFDFETTSRQK